MLVERNHDTTKWPKMDVTNIRSMEILKKLGVEDGIRSVGECHVGSRSIWIASILRHPVT
jgi:hypothetical protein